MKHKPSLHMRTHIFHADCLLTLVPDMDLLTLKMCAAQPASIIYHKLNNWATVLHNRRIVTKDKRGPERVWQSCCSFRETKSSLTEDENFHFSPAGSEATELVSRQWTCPQWATSSRLWMCLGRFLPVGQPNMHFHRPVRNFKCEKSRSAGMALDQMASIYLCYAPTWVLLRTFASSLHLS